MISSLVPSTRPARPSPGCRPSRSTATRIAARIVPWRADFLCNEFANGFEIVERGCPPNDLHTNSRFLRLWPRQLAISTPGLNPLHDLFVRYGGTARFILRQCRFNMLDLPSVQIDVCLNSLARQMRGAAVGVARERIELFSDVRFQANGHDIVF